MNIITTDLLQELGYLPCAHQPQGILTFDIVRTISKSHKNIGDILFLMVSCPPF